MQGCIQSASALGQGTSGNISFGLILLSIALAHWCGPIASHRTIGAERQISVDVTAGWLQWHTELSPRLAVCNPRAHRLSSRNVTSYWRSRRHGRDGADTTCCLIPVLGVARRIPKTLTTE